MDDFQKLLNFFKALGNESRLRIIGILAAGDCTVRELALRLNLKEPTVSEHLTILKQADWVTVRSEGNYRIYSFNPTALAEFNQQIHSREQLAALIEPEDDDKRVLRNYLDADLRLKVFPGSRKKLLIVLRWLASQFEMGRQYTEQEVNQVILRHHEDYATLRREMIGNGLMQRDKGIYWRLE